MQVLEIEPIYDVRVENFKPTKLHTCAGPMARVAIHGFSAEMDRHGQILLVLDRLFSEYENPKISRMPHRSVKKLPPFYRMGSNEGIPNNATLCHLDLENIVHNTNNFHYPDPCTGVFFLQIQIPGANHPTWIDNRFAKIDD